MIINTGNHTDIPAFYNDYIYTGWYIGNLRDEGIVKEAKQKFFIDRKMRLF